MNQELCRSGSKGVEDPNPPKNPKQDEAADREQGMDNTLADSFPASDPPSSIPDPQDEDREDKDDAA